MSVISQEVQMCTHAMKYVELISCLTKAIYFNQAISAAPVSARKRWLLCTFVKNIEEPNCDETESIVGQF